MTAEDIHLSAGDRRSRKLSGMIFLKNDIQHHNKMTLPCCLFVERLHKAAAWNAVRLQNGLK